MNKDNKRVGWLVGLGRIFFFLGGNAVRFKGEGGGLRSNVSGPKFFYSMSLMQGEMHEDVVGSQTKIWITLCMFSVYCLLSRDFL